MSCTSFGRAYLSIEGILDARRSMCVSSILSYSINYAHNILVSIVVRHFTNCVYVIALGNITKVILLAARKNA